MCKVWQVQTLSLQQVHNLILNRRPVRCECVLVWRASVQYGFCTACYMLIRLDAADAGLVELAKTVFRQDWIPRRGRGAKDDDSHSEECNSGAQLDKFRCA